MTCKKKISSIIFEYTEKVFFGARITLHCKMKTRKFLGREKTFFQENFFSPQGNLFSVHTEKIS